MIKERRKRLIVNKLQYKLIRHLLLSVILVSIILVGTTLIIFREEIFVSGNVYWVHFSLILVLALILYIITLKSSIRLSNRIYGPLYRLSIYLEKLSEGKRPEPLNFRKNDIIDGLKETYNRLLKSLEKTLHHDYKELAKTFAQLEDILDRIYNKTITEEELYRNLSDICTRLAKALDITKEVVEKE